MGNVSIDLSLNNIWQSWFKFKRGKQKTKELEYFTYHLEDNLWWLYLDLNEGIYIHGPYQHFTIQDSKRRDIAVATIRDRVVHRLMYEYLVQIYDHTFIYDAWSCRKNKGVIGAIERAQKFFKKYPRGFVWRADVAKFFDNVKQEVFLKIISFRIKDEKALGLIKKIIGSYFCEANDTRERERERERERVNDRRGIPIGNLTSQIFANIYFNEFDRLVKHILKPQFYLRYGDDFIIIALDRTALNNIREQSIIFLRNSLGLEINRKNDIIVPVRRGIHFLGVKIYPTGRCLKKKNWQRAQTRLNQRNVSSYYGLIKQHYKKKINQFDWLIAKLYD